MLRGPNIKPFPLNTALPETVEADVMLKMEDNITTDHIMPSNAKLLPYRSNIPHLSDYCLAPVDDTFPARAKAAGKCFLLAGQNYGQGSSREHAALVPLYIGVKGVIAKSFARIHQSNLINSGILPMVLCDEADYDRISADDTIVLEDARSKVASGEDFELYDKTKDFRFKVRIDASDRLRKILLAGGLINYTRENS